MHQQLAIACAAAMDASEALAPKVRSRFELQFEIYFLLFIAAQIDGQTSAQEQRLRDAVFAELGISAFEKATLQTRVDQLPDYSLNTLHESKRDPRVAQLQARLAYAVMRIDGPLNAGEGFFWNSLSPALLFDAATALEEQQYIDRLISGGLTPPISAASSATNKAPLTPHSDPPPESARSRQSSPNSSN